ncbi:hypothetical protein B0H34DRAFT_417352 [Crassisporium funariophilum]|nr:hypothetical protein B0H34DRAFT_417352 [Crassisporium funariophilum]
MSAAYVTVTALYMLVPSLVAPIMVSAEADVSPNTSAVDLLAFPRTRQASQSSSTTQRIPWHPKLTLYRLLIVSLTVGLAIAKSATSYLNLTFASITLEWILGIVVFLLYVAFSHLMKRVQSPSDYFRLHFIGSYEVHEPRVLPWFFHDDYLEYLWSFIRTFTRFQPPAYLSDERKVGMILTGKHPPITGYRILVTVMALSFGLLKATLSFVGLNMGATTVECIFGVGIVTCLYWLGLYEAGPPGTFVFLFHVDYAPNISYVLHNRKVIFISFLRIIGVLLCSRLSWTFYDAIPMVHAMDYSSDYPIVEQSRRLMFTGVMTYLFVNCTLLVGMLLKSLWEPFHASPIGMQFMRRSGLERIVSVYDEYLVASSSSHSRGQYFYIKRVLLRQFAA